MIQAQPLIAVNNVRASAAFYEALLGVKSAHGGEEYEQLVVTCPPILVPVRELVEI